MAGNSRAGYSGDGGPAVNAQIFTPRSYANHNIDVNNPSGIVADSLGNLYIADSD